MTTPNKRTSGVSITPELIATIEIVPMGQCPPEYSDDVIVKAILYLPSTITSIGLVLHHEILFGERVAVCGEKLHSDWGSTWAPGDDETNSRYRENEFYASTYKEAFEKAAVYASSELQNLIDALRVREAALVAAL